MSKILSIVPSWEETCEKIRKQGYVYCKHYTCTVPPKPWIHKELINDYTLEVMLYPDVKITQKNYGVTFALTREELEEKENNEEN